jgi:phage FluMu protein Com
MWPETVCPSCNGINFAQGTLCSIDPLSFRSEHTRSLRLGAADVEVKAYLCLECGLLLLRAETSAVKSLGEAVSIFAQKAVKSHRS